jgi:hypothetical protein
VIYHLTPWLTGNIGGGINAAIDCLPDDAWICLRDGDTCFLTPQWGKQVEAVVAANGDKHPLIGAMTNRLRAEYQLHDGMLSEDPDLSRHVRIAGERWDEYGTKVAPVVIGPVSGMLMLFRKSTWARHPFPEHSIYFDQAFTEAVRQDGGKPAIALGMYVLHLYRWGKPNPASNVAHLCEVHP